MRLKDEYRSKLSPETLQILDEVCDKISEVDELVYEAVDAVSVVLRLHALSESYLRKIISYALPAGTKISDDSRFSYHHILTIVTALKVLSPGMIGALRKLNKMRNQLAHEISPVVELDKVKEIGISIGPEYLEELGKHEETVASELTTLCIVLVNFLRAPTSLFERGLTLELVRLVEED